MTIDEAIANHKKLKVSAESNNDMRGAFYSAEEHEQYAEWLEELKALKNGLNIKCDNLNEALEKGKKIGYNKAIDDFADKLLSQQVVDKSVVRRIKEQLKGGASNET